MTQYLKSHNVLNFFCVIFLFGLSILTYRHWFSFDQFVYSDWSYTSARVLADFIHLSVWDPMTGFGTPNFSLWRLPIAYLQSLFGLLGFDSSITDKIFFFWEIALLGPIICLYFFTKLTNSVAAGSVSSLVFLFCTYFLAIGTQGHIGITIACILMLPSLLHFILLFDPDPPKNRSVNLFIAVLFAFVTGIYDFRILYVGSGIITLYLIIQCLGDFKKIVPVFKESVKFFSLLSLLNIFWLLPFAIASGGGSVDILSRALWRNNLFSLENALTIHQPFWASNNFKWFVSGEIEMYLWMLPTVVFLIIVFFRKRTTNSIFFITLILIGIFLSKQASRPLGEVYLFLFEHLPGFSAFREASKFYFLVVLGYAGLIGLFVGSLLDSGKKVVQFSVFSVLTIVILLSVLNTAPIISGKICGLYCRTPEPNDNKVLREKISDKNFFRTLWVPDVGVRWGVLDKNHPSLSYYNVTGLLTDDIAQWKQFIPSGDNSVSPIFSLFRQSYLLDILAVSNVKYVILPVENIIDTQNPYRLTNRGDFFNELASNKSLSVSGDLNLDSMVVFDAGSPKAYIRPFSSLYSIPQAFDLSVLKKIGSFEFVYPDRVDSIRAPVVDIQPLFPSNEFQQSFLEKGLVDRKIDNLSRSSMSILNGNASYQVYFEKNKANILTSIRQSESLFVEKFLPEENVFFRSYDLDSSQDAKYVEYNKSLKLLSNSNPTSFPYFESSNTFALYSANNNLIRNGSFEEGLWQDSVTDCDHYDEDQRIDMRMLDAFGPNRENVVELAASRHRACTYTTFAVPPGEYTFSFRYQSPTLSSVSFYISFDDAEEKTTYKKLAVSNPDWNTYIDSFNVPQGTKTARLYVYADSDDEKINQITRYTDFTFAEIQKIGSFDMPILYPDIQNLPRESNEFKLVSSQGAANVISNPSFESGLWQETVSDCKNSDDNPAINMVLSTDERSLGQKSLQLESKRHVACTNQIIPVEVGTYSFSFDFQSPNAKSASYYIGFNNDKNTFVSDTVEISDSGWHTYSKIINIPSGATSATLYFYAYPLDEDVNIINRYDNVIFVRSPNLDDVYYLVSKSDLASSIREPLEVNFELVGPAKKNVHVKSAATPFYLAMAESFHSKWAVELNNEKVDGWLDSWIPWVHPDTIPESYHFKLDGFLNGWYVDPVELCGTRGNLKEGCSINEDGSYNIELIIEFTPQRWFYVGLIISGLTLASCLGYLGYSGIRSYRRRKALRQS